MKRLFSASDWTFQVLKGKSEKEFLVEFHDAGVHELELEVRSLFPVSVSAVTEGGELLPMAVEPFVSFSGRVRGFRAVSIRATSDFAYRAHYVSLRADEIVDPVPVAVNEPLSAYDAMRIAVREEVIRRLAGAGLLDEGVDPDELVEEAVKGDHDWLVEDEDDGFASVSYEDMLEDDPDRFDPDSARQSGSSVGTDEPPNADEVASEEPQASSRPASSTE